jgi:hypothetical protein
MDGWMDVKQVSKGMDGCKTSVKRDGWMDVEQV